MTLEEFLVKLKAHPSEVGLEEALGVIDAEYNFSPTTYVNGGQVIGADKTRSCKLFAFGLLNGLSKPETLACFGVHYRDDVLKHPHGVDHQVIRLFQRFGWDGLKFERMPLTRKK